MDWKFQLVDSDCKPSCKASPKYIPFTRDEFPYEGTVWKLKSVKKFIQ